ncbi:MAG: DNA polymerase III subunit delta' [Gammaproteobacteria bacterium]|nr:DNA polymerase III subunit delta' [Gammaproteobacteria bacterium]
MNAPYPWLDTTWQRLASAATNDRLGHAYLLEGRPGLGKFALAEAFATHVLCEQPAGGAACGHCRSCRLIEGGLHPDRRLVLPEEDRKSIVVDQVRELIDFYALKPHYGRRKVAIIHPAEAMGTAAANALLKVLEEPPAGALLLLVAHRAGQLPATIRSRCQHLRIETPGWTEALAWLAAADTTDVSDLTLAGAPLDLLEQVGDKSGTLYDKLLALLDEVSRGELGALQGANQLGGEDVRAVLDACDLLVRALVQARAGVVSRHLHLGRRAGEHLQRIANHLNSAQLFAFHDKIAEARTTVQRSAGVRGSEVIENLLMGWARTTSTEKTA